MIDENKIREAAKGYCDELALSSKTCVFTEDAFVEGAKWAQEEFVRSLWHEEMPDLAEIPLYKDKLTLDKRGFPLRYAEILTDEMQRISIWSDYLYSEEDWQRYYVKPYGINRWCYVSDFLPKKPKKGGRDE